MPPSASKSRDTRAVATRALLHEKATAWEEIDLLVDTVAGLQELKYYRPAQAHRS